MYEELSTERHRSVDAVIFYRRRTSVNRRVTPTWLVGGAFMGRPQTWSETTREILPDGSARQVSAFTRGSSRNYYGAAFGVELGIHITRSVSVVPRGRATIFPSWFLDDSGLAPS